MKLAFYNGARFGRTLDRIIARQGWPHSYSHVELVFDDLPLARARCFSSSWRDGGVRFKWIDLADGKWQLVRLPALTPAQYEALESWCIQRLGGRYDIPGALSFKLPLVRQLAGAWFCSEICCAALQQVGLLSGLAAHRLSPNDLYRHARARRRGARADRRTGEWASGRVGDGRGRGGP